ncbi:hypothetical protein L1987_12959 [Smallanthus sonchifolius]|uniref:Uncharacterized protein n=1 Tax=Smallanthus sonchifolius TaxID=185202 RepID=A0ACB9JFS5_9ASTR|nr:hypothetical protein L1987_12959 [Smallanthus sonchifolius]
MDVSPLSFGVHRRAFFPSLPTLIPVFFWKEYLFIYNHRLLLVIGLVFSRSLTYNAIVSVLIWYLTSSGDDVVKSAILTNVGEFLSSMFEIVMAHAADSFIGRFQTLLFSTIAYIGALMLFWMFHPSGVSWLLVLNLILLALGTSGDKILQDVVIDFVHDIDKSPSQNITRSITRATIWLRVVYVSGALIAILWVTLGAIGGVDSSWNNYFRICFITMTLAMIIFGVGHIVHYKGEILKYISRYFLYTL